MVKTTISGKSQAPILRVWDSHYYTAYEEDRESCRRIGPDLSWRSLLRWRRRKEARARMVASLMVGFVSRNILPCLSLRLCHYSLKCLVHFPTRCAVRGGDGLCLLLAMWYSSLCGIAETHSSSLLQAFSGYSIGPTEPIHITTMQVVARTVALRRHSSFSPSGGGHLLMAFTPHRTTHINTGTVPQRVHIA